MTPTPLRLGIVFLVLLSCGPSLPFPAAAPAADTIELGVTTLSLGMTQQKVIDALAEVYKVEKTHGGSESSSSWSSWDIHTRAAPFKRIGSVAFKDGKLTSVIKEWGPYDQQKGVELATALYGAIAQFVKEGKRSCVISTGTNQTPQAEFKSAFIACGGKYLQVSITLYGGEQAAYISEILEGTR